MRGAIRRTVGLVLGVGVLGVALTGSASAAAPTGSASAAAATRSGARPLSVTWLTGARSPGTPARYDRVGVLKVGSPAARNVLVLEPGTEAGSAYFVPLARWIVARAPGWQVWSVERRENLLEDQSELNLAKRGRVTATQLFDYYLGWVRDPSIHHHVGVVAPSSVGFAKGWGMSVAVGDLRAVIRAAQRLGGKVVLGGHSLGGDVVTAYATWDFAGRPGADGLSGLVYIDGGSFGSQSAASAAAALAALDARSASPWLAFGGIPSPLAGLFSVTGAETALIAPDQPSLGQSSGLLDLPGLAPPVPVTNLGQYGFPLNVATSPPSLIAAQAHLGAGLASTGGPPYGWNGAGALTPISRFASMFAGSGVNGADGTEWYFPARLTLDTAAVNDGIGDGAQRVLGERATMGRRLPRDLRIDAFAAALSAPGGRLLAATRRLARQSRIPARNLTLVSRPDYAHNDPNAAYPRNAFFARLIPFLRGIGGR